MATPTATRHRGRAATIAIAAVAAGLGLAACGDTAGYTSSGNRVDGKELFVNACGSCHTLADAQTTGVIGPDLDDGFRQFRRDSEGENPDAEDVERANDTITQVVRDQISYPVVETVTGAPGMPGIDDTLPACSDAGEPKGCVDDQDRAADDIAVYVASVAGVEAAAP